MKIFTTPQLQAAVCSHVQKELPVFHEIRNRLSYPTKGWKADILDLTVTMVSQMDTAFLGFPSWTVLLIDKILNKKLCLDVVCMLTYKHIQASCNQIQQGEMVNDGREIPKLLQIETTDD